MRRSRIAVAAATATALVGSIAAITPSPQAEASSNRPRSVAQAAIATDGKGIINKDCRDAVINDAKLRAAIAGALVKAGFSSADAVALAPRIAREMAKEGVLLINHHKLKALIGAQVGLLTDAKIQRAAAAVDLGIKATLAATIIPNALHSAMRWSQILSPPALTRSWQRLRLSPLPQLRSIPLSGRSQRLRPLRLRSVPRQLS